jgi:hypothetical protein
MKNYTFIKPYKTTIGSKDAKALSMGATPFQEINFKIGDKINGSPYGGEDTNRVVETRVGNVNLNIPPEYLKEEAENQLVVNAPSKDVAPQTFLEKNKTNLLIVGVLVLGYLAYKKFNK